MSGIKWPNGSVVFTYDVGGHLTRKLYTGGLDLKFTYDSGHNLLSADGIKLAYNALGSVVNSNGLAIGRDAANRITGITYAKGKTVNYVYDCRGLVTKITDWVGDSTQFAYDDARQLTSITRPNGVVTTLHYDKSGRLTRIDEKKTAALSSIELQRDAAGQITSANRNTPLSASLPNGVATYTYDAASQLSGEVYDGQGRPLKQGLRAYQWDPASRLASYTGPDGSGSFAYDARGLRISRTSVGQTEKYVLNYALGRPSIGIVRNSAGDQSYYVNLPDGTLLYSIEAQGNSRHFYHFDETGSTLFLTDDHGAITDRYAVSPYGEAPAHSGSSHSPFTFLGAYGVMQEGDTGLYYMGARYYDSITARFLTRDFTPTLDPKAINPYQYARANPLTYTDPLGSGSQNSRRENKAEGGDFSRLGFSLEAALARDPDIGRHWAAHPAMIGLLHFLGGSDSAGVFQYIANIAGLYCQFRPCSRICAALAAWNDFANAEAGEVRGPVLGERIGEWGAEGLDGLPISPADEEPLLRVAGKGLRSAASAQRCEALPNNAHAIGAFGGGREAETRIAPPPEPQPAPANQRNP